VFVGESIFVEDERLIIELNEFDCRDAAMMQMRRATENLSVTQIQERAKELKEKFQSPATADDFRLAMSKISSSVSKETLERYDKWMKEFGSI